MSTIPYITSTVSNTKRKFCAVRLFTGEVQAFYCSSGENSGFYGHWFPCEGVGDFTNSTTGSVRKTGEELYSSESVYQFVKKALEIGHEENALIFLQYAIGLSYSMKTHTSMDSVFNDQGIFELARVGGLTYAEVSFTLDLVDNKTTV